jgi:hypothetical protein
MEPVKKALDAADPLNGISSSISGKNEEEAVDWDFRLEVKPARRSGVVHANVEYVGRAKPIPLSDPEISGTP